MQINTQILTLTFHFPSQYLYWIKHWSLEDKGIDSNWKGLWLIVRQTMLVRSFNKSWATHTKKKLQGICRQLIAVWSYSNVVSFKECKQQFCSCQLFLKPLEVRKGSCLKKIISILIIGSKGLMTETTHSEPSFSFMQTLTNICWKQLELCQSF